MAPPTLITTPGGSASNSYCTLAEAEAYQSSRLYVDNWTAATDDVKTAALAEACRRLDASFEWTGGAASDTQALCWPRTGMASRNKFPISPAVIPQALKEAQAEFACGLA